MDRPAWRTRGQRKRAAANVTPPVDKPSTSSVTSEDQKSPVPSSSQGEQNPHQEEAECALPETNRCMLDDDNRHVESSEESRTNEGTAMAEEANAAPYPPNRKRRRIYSDAEESMEDIRTDSEAVTKESSTNLRTDSEAHTSESLGPAPTRAQEDVMIVGDVQVARPEVIDLERLPTIRQGGSVVVDLTNDASFHDSNVVDLTRENSADSSVDSSPVIVCVNRIYHRDPTRQLPSCRFASFPSMLDVGFNTAINDDEIQEVSDGNTTSTLDKSLDASTSSTDDPVVEGTKRNKITCPICWDDEETIKRRKRQLMSTTCGHIFCDKCIRNAVQIQNKCPTCRKKLSLRQLHPIFL